MRCDVEINEVWVDIKGYEGLYKVSNLGNVSGVDRVVEYSNGAKHFVKGVIKSQRKNSDGYYRVSLSKGSSKESLSVSVLVATHFIDNPENKPQVNHITGDKSRNEFYNLEWATNKENMDHARKTGLIQICHGDNHKWSKLNSVYISQILDILKFTHFTQREIGDMYGVSHSVISRIKTGIRWGKTIGLLADARG